jgi:hypothetical protein
VGATINLGDEDEIDGDMKMIDGEPTNDKNFMVIICLFGWWVGLQCSDI